MAVKGALLIEDHATWICQSHSISTTRINLNLFRVVNGRIHEEGWNLYMLHKSWLEKQAPEYSKNYDNLQKYILFV